MSPKDMGPQSAITPPADPAFVPRGIPIPFSIPVSDPLGVTVCLSLNSLLSPSSLLSFCLLVVVLMFAVGEYY